MILFDTINNTVKINGVSVVLQPLSIKLLERLAHNPGEVVSIDDLFTSVWQNVSVSPETLKQRVFVLRKAISASNVKGVTIHAVRGEGYRLILDLKSTSQLKNMLFQNMRWWIDGIALAVTFAVFLFFSPLDDLSRPVNNRIALWTNIALIDMSKETASTYENWRTMISEATQKGHLQLMHSIMQPDVLLPTQARKSRIGLISYFEETVIDGKPTVRLQIIEARTSTILRSDILELSETKSVIKLLEQHLSGMKRLVSSGKLDINKKQKDNAEDQIWGELRQLAGST